MKRIYLFGLALALTLAGANMYAQEQEAVLSLSEDREFSKVGVGTGTFLNLPVGARATALGTAFVGMADDATALYWNPAGITRTPGSNVTGSYSAMFAGITHNFAAATFSVGESYKAGISATTLSSGDIEVTDLFNQEGTGGFYSATDLAFGLSIAGQLTDQFSFGATGKLVNMSIADVSASGVAFDFGTMYDPGILGLTIGFAIQNLSAPLKYAGPDLIDRGETDPVTGNRASDVELEATTVSLPLIFRAGVAAEFMEDNDDHMLTASTEFRTMSNASEQLGLGVEYVWKNLLVARAGYQLGSTDAYGMSGGVGIIYDSGPFYAILDYAIRPHTTLGLINTVTASVRIR